MLNLYVGAVLLTVVLSAISQVLLKKSSGETKKHIIYEYLNVKVIVAYLIYLVTAVLTVYAFTGIEYRLGTILGTLTYLLFMLCGRIFFKEKITPRRLIGNCVIIIGIVVFTLNM